MTGPMRDGAPVRCDEHGGRPECTRQTKRGTGRCHGLAIDGLDVCRMHVGVSGEVAKAKGQAALARQRFRDVEPSEYLDPGDVLLWSVTLARVDLADYRAELRARPATAAPGDAELDRLARLIDQAARMSKMALDAKVDERRLAMHEALGDRLTAFVRSLLLALGHDPSDPQIATVARQQLELVAGQSA